MADSRAGAGGAAKARAASHFAPPGAGAPSVRRPAQRGAVLSVVPLIDVMLILLVFFMVTSTYLDLDMVPAGGAAATPLAGPSGGAAGAAPLLVRLGPDGRPVLGGQPLTLDALERALALRVAQAPATAVVLLPSGAADLQALVAVMDRVTQAGVPRLRVIRLAGQD